MVSKSYDLCCALLQEIPNQLDQWHIISKANPKDN